MRKNKIRFPKNRFRLPAAALAGLMLLLSVPMQADAEDIRIIPFQDEQTAEIIPFYDAEKTGTSYLEEMEQQNITSPSGYEADTATPYGTDVGEPVTLLENTELFFYASSNLNKKESEQYFVSQMTSGNPNTFGNLSLSNASINGFGKSEALSYTQGVAFDATGCGRRNYIGLVGYEASSKSVVAVVLDAQSKQRVQKMTLASGEEAAWIESCAAANNQKGLDTVDSGNFFQITAGDYNGDGRDSLVIWCGSLKKSSRGGYETLSEIYMNDSGSWQAVRIRQTGEANAYLNREYLYACSDADLTSTDLGKRLGVSLASGDVNDDGVDDLAVISYGGKNHSCWKPYLSVGLGQDGKNTIADLAITTRASSSDGVSNMIAPGISIGDLDGDGGNEIAVAGFGVKNLGHSEVDKKTALFAAYQCSTDANGSHTLQCMRTASLGEGGIPISPIGTGDSIRENESCIQQFAVECVDFDGLHSRTYIFLNGYFYQLDHGGNLKRADNLSFFEDLQREAKDIKDVNENFIYSAAVGNFFGDHKSGKEQIVMTVGYKENKARDYSFRRIVIGKNGSNWQISGTGKDEWVVRNNGDATQQKLNCFVVAMDNDFDSVIGKLSSRAFAYTDPNVVAVLQAAPYFQEFEAGNSSTTYGYSESYAKTTARGREVSYNIGISSEVSAGPLTVSSEAGCAFEVDEEFSTTRTTEFTTTFEANGENQIIVRRTLLYFYNYDVMGSDGTFQENAMTVAVPQYPVMTSLNMGQYNEFAEAYNSKYADDAKINANGAEALFNSSTARMTNISDSLKNKYYLNNEGNPFGYAPDSTVYGTRGKNLCKDGWMSLAHAGGTTQEAYTVSEEESFTKTNSDGMYMNMAIMAGGGPSFASVSAGISTSYEELRRNSVSEAHMTATSTGGSVQNLEDAHRAYNFRWKLIGWKSDGDLFDGVPFVGYAVEGVSAPVQPVQDLVAVYTPAENASSFGSVTLTWTSPVIGPKRGEIDTFRIYRTDRTTSDGSYTVAREVKNTGAGTKMSCVIPLNSSYAGRQITFVMRSSPKNADDIWSIYSNEAACDYTMTDREVHLLVEKTSQNLQDKMDALNAQIASGEQGSTEALTRAVQELTEAYQNADQVLQLTMEAKLQQNDDKFAAQIKALQDSMTAAQNTLQKSIDQIQSSIAELQKELQERSAELEQRSTELEQKSAELQQAIEEGNQRTETLSQEVADLQAAVDALQSQLGDQQTRLQEQQDQQTQLKQELQTLQEQSRKDQEAMQIRLQEEQKAREEAQKAYAKEQQSQAQELKRANVERESLAAENTRIKTQLDRISNAASSAGSASAAPSVQSSDGKERNQSIAKTEPTATIPDTVGQTSDVTQQMAETVSAQEEGLNNVQNELETLKAETASQNKKNQEAIASLLAANQEQGEKLQSSRRVMILALVLLGAMLVGNGVVLIRKAFKKNKH